MATGGNEVASDEFPDFLDFQCVSCDNRTVVKYCVDCQGYCCRSCFEDHVRFPTMKGHTLLDKSHFQTQGSPAAKLPTVPTERCSIHTTKILDMCCADHDVVGCTTCMALNHRSCDNVHSIPDEIDIDLLFKPSAIYEVRQHLQYSKGTLDDIRNKEDEHLEKLRVSKEEADNTKRDARNEIVAAANYLEKKSLEEVENMYQVMKTSIEKEKKEATDQASGKERVSDCLAASEGNKAQQSVCMKIASRKISNVKDVELCDKIDLEGKISVTVDPSIQACFRNMETFEKISVTSSVRTEVYKVEKCRDMNVRLPQESSFCHIFDSCWTEDSSLLLVDYNNRKLKRATIKTMTINGYCSFDASPHCVCCINSQEAIVTFYSNANFIQFVSLGNQLTLSRKVKISHNCLGIACKGDKLYIADNARTLYIHDMNGNQLQAVSRDSSGNDLFSVTRHVAFNDTGHGIFVADWSKGVVIFDDQYQHVTSFSHSELKDTVAVCTDRRGNIFVCGYYSQNVLQIGHDGKKRGVVVSKSDGVNYPQSVCFDQLHCKLIVTQNNDIVKIFDLK